MANSSDPYCGKGFPKTETSKPPMGGQNSATTNKGNTVNGSTNPK